LQKKAVEIIKFHGGADETTLMTGLVPYLYEQALLHRIAKYDLRVLLENGPFVYLPKEKKWFTKDMVGDSDTYTPMARIPAEALVENIVHSYLSEHKRASMDELLVAIYTQLVNSDRPQIGTIDKVVAKYCKKIRVKGQKRDIFVWNPSAKTPQDIEKILSAQTAIDLDVAVSEDHNTIIERIAHEALKIGLAVHVGKTEQKKSPKLRALSADLTGLELGLPPSAFRLIQEIDVLILKGNSILSAIEVATTISTFNKAINDRFRNLLSIVPNLAINLNVVVKDVDWDKAVSELYTRANVDAKLTTKVTLHRISEIWSAKNSLDIILGLNR
jgi:hypothetical protein